MLAKFEFQDSKSAETSMAERPLISSDPEGNPIDQTYYQSMIGSMMYLTASRPDIMFAVCQCACFQANPKFSRLIAVNHIFRYPKGQPKLGFWYPKNSDFDLYAFADSSYGGYDIDKKSTLAGCQFLGDRLISWQCKKQQTVSTSTAKAEYVAASACCFSQMVTEFWNNASINQRGAGGFVTIDSKIQKNPAIISEAIIRDVLLFGDQPDYPTEYPQMPLLKSH
ncbi:secreted RxLR effector protein 161-like [Bidens hawaiensis]|uniref:secreted RxLR effector protein 161-like n=1 Tax=Bidens hawaiensis TaxID=980011 RepID=UPI00404B5382